MKTHHYRYLGYFLLTGIVFLSLLPGKSLAKLNWDQLLSLDKLGHFFMYGITAGCFYLSRIEANLISIYRVPGLALISLGLVLEGMQHCVGLGRTFDWLDVLANMTGIMVSGYLIKYFHQNHQTNLNQKKFL